MNEEEIQHLLKFKTQWWNELRIIQKAEKGIQSAFDATNKSVKRIKWNGLAFNKRTSEFASQN
jgi:hypothetical protein